jgi:hypothetical protein
MQSASAPSAQAPAAATPSDSGATAKPSVDDILKMIRNRQA